MERTLLDGLAAAPDLPETTTAAFRLGHAAEELIAQDAEMKYRKARKKAHGRRLRH